MAYAETRATLTIIPNYVQITKSVEANSHITGYNNLHFVWELKFRYRIHNIQPLKPILKLINRVLVVNPLHCIKRFSITKTSERGPFSIQPTSLNDENTHSKGV